MSSTYQLKVNDTFCFDVDTTHMNPLDVVSVAADYFHILEDKKRYQAKIISANFLKKEYIIEVNSSLYTVAIADALDLLIKEMGFDSLTAQQVNAINAPMPGLILEINVVVGQSVQENENLIILGAMKMENSFQSPKNGVIKSIAVAVGDAVDKGQLLVEFE